MAKPPPCQIRREPSQATSSHEDNPAERESSLRPPPTPPHHPRSPKNHTAQTPQRWWTCRHPENLPAQSPVRLRQRHSHAGRAPHAGAKQTRSPVRPNRCRHLRGCSFLARRPTPRGPDVRRRIAPHRYRKSRNNLHQGTRRRASSAGRRPRRVNRHRRISTHSGDVAEKCSPILQPYPYVK